MSKTLFISSEFPPGPGGIGTHAFNVSNTLRKRKLEVIICTVSDYVSDEQAKNFDDNGLLEVDNLKGFAIFFNISKFKKNFFDENFFLYFEEIDLCKDLKKRGGKIYLSNKIVIDHLGASSVKKNQNFELEKNRNWHWMWSTFYFHKKHKGFMIALIIISPKIFSSLIKIVFYQIIFNKEKRNIFICRLNGIINSILGKKSWYRPSLD